MGYQRSRTFSLEFAEDSEFAGLEVKARSLTGGGLMNILDAVELLDKKGVSLAEMRQLDKLFRVFAGCPADCDQEGHIIRDAVPLRPVRQLCPSPRLVSWNLEDENGRPTPATYEGFMGQDFEFIQVLLKAWLEGVIGTPGPLDESSNNGGQSVEVSIPMATLSADHMS